MSQQKLANAVGVDITRIGKYELGERRPSPETAKRMAEALHFEKHGYDWTKFFEDEKAVV